MVNQLDSLLEAHDAMESAKQKGPVIRNSVVLSFLAAILAVVVTLGLGHDFLKSEGVTVVLGLVLIPIALAGPPFFVLRRQRRRLESTEAGIRVIIGEMCRDYPAAIEAWGGMRVLDNAATVAEIIKGVKQGSMTLTR